MTLRQAQALPGVTSARKVDNNTFELIYSNGNRAIRLHDTNIIIYYPDGTQALSTGGYRTNVTKARMNAFSNGLIKSKNGDWMITIRGKEYEFFSGMRFNDSGDLINSPEKIEQENREEATAGLKSIAAIAMMGSIFGNNQKESNDWKARMIKAGLGEGIQMPDDWDQLSEDEKERRLEGVIGILGE
jgi:hypothetical protein